MSSPLLTAMTRCLDLLDPDERAQLLRVLVDDLDREQRDILAAALTPPRRLDLRQHPAGCPRDPYPHGDCSYPDPVDEIV